MKPEAAKDAAKILTIQVSTGGEDERSLEKLLEDVTEALGDSVKRITVFGQYYLIDGEPVRPENVPEPVVEKPKKKATKRGKGAETEKAEKGAAARPEDKSAAPEHMTCARCDAEVERSKVDGLLLSTDDTSYYCWGETHNNPDAPMHTLDINSAPDEPKPTGSSEVDDVRKLAAKAAPGRMTMRKREA